MNGFINFIKPPGMSSAQAVFFVKKLIGQKAGHAGTLDPEAAGILPIMVGRGTKLFDYITDDLKVYLAEITFGASTDTQDAQGRILEKSARIPTQEEIKDVLGHFEGDILQVPPMYSALQQDGKRLYALAREGKTLEIAPRPVRVYSIAHIRQTQEDSHLLRIHCGKGTYIRTLCHDIGEKLHSKAHMRFLLREQVGAFRMQEGVTMEELSRYVTSEAPEKAWLQPPDKYLEHIPRIDVPSRLEKKLINGVSISREELPGNTQYPEDSFLRMYLQDEFICISQVKDGMLAVSTMYKTQCP